MNKLFYHPERSKQDSVPVFSDSNQHGSVWHFLRAIEIMEPGVVQDLKELLPLYEETENNKDIKDDWSEWKVIAAASEEYNPELIPLREAVKKWGLKYNLVDPEFKQTTYLEVAIWALSSLYSHDEYAQRFIKLCKEMDSEVPDWAVRWTLAGVIHFETEEDDIQLKNTFGEKDFSRLFPFVFTPDVFSDELFWVKNEDARKEMTQSADFFEGIIDDYEQMKNLTLHGKNQEYLEHLYPWKGKGWDPRVDSWQEFEKEIDMAYNAYKKAYRARTELFMKENGYLVGPEKRNIEHFQWLVRYQLQGWKVSQIADVYSKKGKIISEDAVYKALKCTAALVGITLRNNDKEG